MPPYNKYNRSDIVRFLRTVDDCLLGEDLEICVIGGVAAVVGYNANVKTADIDVFTISGGNAGDRRLRAALKSASALTGVDLLIDRATIADLPYNYEDRARPVRGVRFKWLTMKVPDKYDLILSKAVRCAPHDLEAASSIHHHHPLSERTLATRFETEIRKEAVIDRRKFDFHMVLMMRELFGETRAEFYKVRWAALA
jgi:hypothetical protein